MTHAAASTPLVLVRHTRVCAAWQSRCYGKTDVALGVDGRHAARPLSEALAAHRPALVFTSPMRRARWLAAHIARHARAPLFVDARLAERDFGTWEGRPWDDIYAETGDAMMGMLSAPDTFRPGGGETTHEMCVRAVSWRNDLPAATPVVAVCHGGPIAALGGTARGLAPKDWAPLIPSPGGSITL